MLVRGRPLTWSLIRYGLNHFHQARCCFTSVLCKDEGKWIENISNKHLLEIEKAWKDRIAAENVGRCSKLKGAGKKYYVLSMFPYPSGKLHMGHVRVYVISDLMARYNRMLGHEVIHPMGWDAFGLPAENAAIQRKLDPKQWTYSNIKTMKTQMDKLLCSFDWDREVVTCDPSYYKWTQHIFLKMFEKGLAYQKEAEVNWDPVDRTVLADEQVDDKGCSWRSGAEVERRFLNQWYICTTRYSQSLLDGLDTVSSDLWRDVIQLQRNWIGETTGCDLQFKLLNNGEETGESLSVFTEFPECIHGASFLAISSLHKYNNAKYHKIQDESRGSSVDRTLTLEARHPITGQPIPVIAAVGTSDKFKNHDVYLGIPSQCSDDREIADRNDISWTQVLAGDQGHEVMVNSGKFNGMSRQEAREAIMELAQETGFGGYRMSSHLKDWLISRQRYWGTPIPVIHCKSCKAVPVPFEDLPVILPDKMEFGQQASTDPDQDDQIRSPLYNNKDWLEVKCPKCGGPAERETDTMDTFVDSSWYFYRYLDSQNTSEPFSRQAADNGMPVDLYIGGKEHAYMHLYYARFFSHFLCDEGLSQQREPFVTLLTQGMVKADSFKLKSTGMYVPRHEVKKTGKTYTHEPTGEPLIHYVEKMSKSKYNGTDPEDLLDEFGIDMTRLCILSNVAPKSDRRWDTNVYLGVQRWLNRVWSLVRVLVRETQDKGQAQEAKIDLWNNNIRAVRNKYLMEIRYHLDTTFLINTAISRMHEITSDLKKVPRNVAVSSKEYHRAVADLVIMMAPFAPMFASEMWSLLRDRIHDDISTYDLGASVLEQQYPEPDAEAEAYVDVMCYGVPIGKLTVNYSSLDNLTEAAVTSLLKKQDFFESVIKQETVQACRVIVYPRYRATADLVVPGLRERMQQMKEEKAQSDKHRQKEKKQKKASKESAAAE